MRGVVPSRIWRFFCGVVQFISKVSDSEQTKRAVLNKTRTALNVIL